MQKAMDTASSNFLRDHGAIVHAEDQNTVHGEYKYVEDTQVAHLGLSLQGTTRLRSHQEQALASVFPAARVPRIARSGVLEMPCGSGKTLTGIAIACKIQKSTLVICNNSDAVNHWRSEFLRFSNISEYGITRATGDIKEKLFKNSGVFITTYQMLSGRGKSKHSQYHIETAKSRVWGCLLYDEVHHLPAARNSVIANLLQAKCKIGLTGTYNREDRKISELDTLVGPCLYRTNLQFLREQQLVANIMMKQLLCDMTPEFMRAYNCIRGKSAHRVRSILSVLSPHKFHTVLSLITMHEAQGDKILVFVDNKYEIQEYSTRLNRSFISGDTDKQVRESLFNSFLTGNAVNTLLITRTGDESLNLPIANVVIQTSFHHGANNQEMQRLGRILRPKGGAAVQGKIEGVFYSLVSNETREMVYAKKRRKLVISDGVDYIEEVAPIDPTVHFPTTAEQANLLQLVLEKYADSAYLDTVNPSDHAKKIQQELKLQAAQKAQQLAAESSSEEDGDEEEDSAELSESDEEETEENATTPPKVNGAQLSDTCTTTNTTQPSETIKDNNETDTDQQLTGKKRNEPEPASDTTSAVENYRRAKVSAPTVKKAFQPKLPIKR